jgi:hypothetical protein
VGDLFHRSMKEPSGVALHGGRDEYGPYLGFLDVNGLAINTVPTGYCSYLNGIAMNRVPTWDLFWLQKMTRTLVGTHPAQYSSCGYKLSKVSRKGR